MYHGDRRPHSIPKDDWGYHRDATEIPLHFIPYLMHLLDKSVSPEEARQMVSCSVHPEYFTVHIPGNWNSMIIYNTLEGCISEVQKEQPSRMISMNTDEDKSIFCTFIRELAISPDEAFM